MIIDDGRYSRTSNEMDILEECWSGSLHDYQDTLTVAFMYSDDRNSKLHRTLDVGRRKLDSQSLMVSFVICLNSLSCSALPVPKARVRILCVCPAEQDLEPVPLAFDLRV